MWSYSGSAPRIATAASPAVSKNEPVAFLLGRFVDTTSVVAVNGFVQGKQSQGLLPICVGCPAVLKPRWWACPYHNGQPALGAMCREPRDARRHLSRYATRTPLSSLMPGLTSLRSVSDLGTPNRTSPCGSTATCSATTTAKRQRRLTRCRA